MKKLLFYLLFVFFVGQPGQAFQSLPSSDRLSDKTSCSDINNSKQLMPSLISPGDKITYKVLNQPSSDVQTITIDSRGASFIPGIGTTSFANVYEQELSNKIGQIYKSILLNPVIDVITVKRATQLFTISGAVESPGVYTIDNSSSINRSELSLYGVDTSEKFSKDDSAKSFFDIIKIAGGFTLEADTSNILIYYQSKNGRICKKADLTAAILGKEWTGYIPVSNNMQILVKTRKENDPNNLSNLVIKKSTFFSKNKSLILFGQFYSPGVYKYDQKPSLGEVLAKAGGLTLESSKNIFIIPPSKEDGSYNAKDIQKISITKADNLSVDIDLPSGTLVYAPESKAKILQMRLSQVTSILNPLLTVYGLYVK